MLTVLRYGTMFFGGKRCLDLHEKLQRQHSVCSLPSFLWRHPWKPPCFWNSQAELAKEGLPTDLVLSHLSSSLMVLLMQDSVSRNPGQIPLPLTLGSTGGFCRKLWGKAAEVRSLPCWCRRFTTQWVSWLMHTWVFGFGEWSTFFYDSATSCLFPPLFFSDGLSRAAILKQKVVSSIKKCVSSSIYFLYSITNIITLSQRANFSTMT